MWYSIWNLRTDCFYCIEADDLKQAEGLVESIYCLELPIEGCDVYRDTTLAGLLGQLKISLDQFVKSDISLQLVGIDGGVYFLYIEEAVKVVRAQDGEWCRICSQFCGMSEANQPDGSFVCWNCRDTESWRF